MKNILYLFSAITIFFCTDIFAQEKAQHEFKTRLEVENRYFFHDPLYESQKRNYLSLAIQPEYLVEWNNRKYSVKVNLFGRLDQYDSRRTHADVRELYWQMVQPNYELSIGIKKIFWGVTESVHLVNIINQTDVVESFDGEAKLGQPMMHLSFMKAGGTFDFFVMPYFRTQTFPGRKGRLRTPIVLNGDDLPYESKMENYHPEAAVRWSKSIGVFDVGISHFYGTDRQPIISNLEQFDITYRIVNQTGADVQATTGPVLWKFEGIYNSNKVKNYTSLATGFEYTISNIGGKGIDLGLLSEYLYDSRDELAFSSMQNDLFLGTRLGFNDRQGSELLAGTIMDLDHGTTLFSVEGSRRIKDSWKIELEGRIFNNVSGKEFLYFFRKDSFVKLTVNKYF